MSVPADNSRKSNAKIVTNERKNKAGFDFHCECSLFSMFASNVVKRFKLSKKHFANVWSCVEKRIPYANRISSLSINKPV